MSRRRAPTRRTKQSARVSVGRFWILIVAVALVLSAGSAFAEFWPGFYPKQIVVSGNVRVDRATILRAADVAGHRSIWLQSIRSMASRIAAIPFIGRATVHRYPPGTIAIRVVERVPFAVVRRNDDEATVDDALRVLEDGADGDALPVFVLRGNAPLVPGTFLHSNEALTLRNVYAALRRATIAPSLVSFDRYGQVEAATTGGLRLLLGEPNDLDDKVRLCDAILSQTLARRRKPETIDLRAPSTPVVTYATHG